jgi:sarcosine reductase
LDEFRNVKETFLELLEHGIREIRLETPSRLQGDILQVNPDDIRAIVAAEPGIRIVRIEAVAPETSVRMAPVMDVVEPRAKEDPERTAFPGWTGPPGGAGRGRTHSLKGAAVVAVCRLSGVQEGIVDMTAEAAPFCPFSRTRNLVLAFEAEPGTDRVAADEAIRKSLLEVAEFLGGLSRGMEPSRAQVLRWPPPPCSRPRAGLVYLVQSQGDLRRTYVYGHPVDRILPTILDPLEVLDGAVVSGNFVIPSNKNCTYIHQNHPLILAMLGHHGREVDFAGVILANEMSRLEDKERSAAFVVKLARFLKAEGLVINQEGGGNTLTDVMMVCRLLKREGIRTVLVVNEFAGEDGTTPSLTETTPEATAIVSTGNNDQRITLPAVKEFIGFPPFPGVEGNLTREITVPLSRVCGSTNQLGFNTLSCTTV